jgi:uncharacterized membrane protein
MMPKNILMVLQLSNMRYVLSAVLVLLSFLPAFSYAAELLQDERTIVPAQVVFVGELEEESSIWGDNSTHTVQNIVVEIQTGESSGKRVELKNEFSPLKVGETLFVNRVVDFDGVEWFEIYELNRTKGTVILVAFFVFVLLVFGRLQGLRSLIALGSSVAAIVFILIPSILAGYSPVVVSVGVATLILFFALFFTHGFNRRSLIAFVGTVGAVALTGILTYFSIDLMHLSGISSEEETYLNLNTGGTLDLVGLLLGAIIIGMLGALDDIAVTQVAVVRELFALGNKKLTVGSVYMRAMRVGREHVGALVNTLVLAYTGSALPLILLYAQTASTISLIHFEMFSVEIVRMILGSIGLVVAVPLTTILAAFFLKNDTSEYVAHEHAHTHHH